MKKIILILLVIIASVYAFFYFQDRKVPLHIENFEECRRMSGKIIETSPRQCVFGGNQYFIEEMNGNSKEDVGAMAEVDSATEPAKKVSVCTDISFSDFAVTEINFASQTPEIDFIDFPEAAKYKEQIMDQIASSTRYAGSYLIVDWSCGDKCHQHIIIDSNSGKVKAFGLKSREGIEAKSDSRLLILNGEIDSARTNSEDVVYYQLGTNSNFEEVCREERTSTVPINNHKEYNDNEIGLSFKYPSTVVFGEIATDTNSISLIITKEKISDLAGTMGFDKETAEKDVIALTEGKFGETLDMPIDSSKKVFSLGTINAKDFTVLGRFDICDVVFERKLVFYKNDYQIVLTLYGNSSAIINGSPQFFRVNYSECGQTPTWKDKSGFLAALEDDEGSIPAQLWYDTFEEIEKTIVVQ